MLCDSCGWYVESVSLKLSPGQVVYAHQFVNLTGENLTDTSLFEDHLCSLLCDLTGLAMGKYSKVGGSLHLELHEVSVVFPVGFFFKQTLTAFLS